MIQIKRIYDKAGKKDGMRILVDRLWPRGVSKKTAQIDLWLKDAAPSPELRTWFSHDKEKFSEFKKLYLRELESRKDAVGIIKKNARKKNLTLLYAARDSKCNHAVILLGYVNRGMKTR